MTTIKGLDQLVTVRHRNHFGVDSRALQRAAGRGSMTRLRSGAYVPTAVWTALDAQERMRLEAAAAAAVGRSTFVASHATAAALWGIPTIWAPDGLVHARASANAGTRTEHGIRKHAVHDIDLHVTEVLGVPATTLERTVIDLALAGRFDEAVVAADWALRFHTTRESLQRTLDELGPARARAKGQRVIDFADPRSGSVGESWSRAQIADGGLPAPILQARFDDRNGLIGFVDFYWPDFGLIGEFDGMVKFTDPAMLKDRSAWRAFKDEKRREDRLRGCGPRVSRRMWDTLCIPNALVTQLHDAGLPRLAIPGRAFSDNLGAKRRREAPG